MRLTLREALASDRLEDFVRQEEARGLPLAKGSDLERALALLITQRRLGNRTSRSAEYQQCDQPEALPTSATKSRPPSQTKSS
jgi:hypothetical protein